MVELAEKKDMQVTWFALIMEQKNHDEGTRTWLICEDIIRKLEKELGIKERPGLLIVKN